MLGCRTEIVCPLTLTDPPSAATRIDDGNCARLTLDCLSARSTLKPRTVKIVDPSSENAEWDASCGRATTTASAAQAFARSTLPSRVAPGNSPPNGVPCPTPKRTVKSSFVCAASSRSLRFPETRLLKCLVMAASDAGSSARIRSAPKCERHDRCCDQSEQTKELPRTYLRH